jgi:hypothetical protein
MICGWRRQHTTIGATAARPFRDCDHSKTGRRMQKPALPQANAELSPLGLRASSAAVAFVFNAPRFISCIRPSIAGTLIVGLGGYGPTATLVGSFFVLGLIAAPFLPETKGKPLPP